MDETAIHQWVKDQDERRRIAEEEERAAYAAVTDTAVLAVLDVLAPARDGRRFPLFEWGHETEPTPAEMIELARQIVAAIRRGVEA